MAESAHDELVIRPTSGWFNLNLADVWRYRDLLYLLVYREFVSKYKQTILGPAWFVIQPLLMTLMFTVVFGGVAKLPTDETPSILFYLCGLLGWNYFAQTFQTTASTFIANAGLFGKVYFPRLVAPLSAVISNFLALFIQLATLLVAWGYFKLFTHQGPSFGFDISIVMLPLLLLYLAALSLGTGLWLSAMTAKYRDFVFLIPLLIQLWMYATPVIYPLSRVPERWRWVAALNPMTVPTEATRLMFLGHGTVSGAYILLAVGITSVVLVTGIFAFSRVEKTFVDTI